MGRSTRHSTRQDSAERNNVGLHSTGRNSTRHSHSLLFAISCSLACALPAYSANAQQETSTAPVQTQTLSLQLTAQPLSQALLALAKQARFTMAAPAGLLQDHQIPALTGDYSLSQALQHMFAGSGLSYRWSNTRNLVIESEANPAQQADTTKQDEEAIEPEYYRPIEEVLVTAQRHQQDLQQVPIALSVVDKSQIERAALSNLSDISTRVPGLSISSYSLGQPSIHMRGIGSNDDGAAMDSSAVLFVDDVYIGRISTIDLGVLDVERVEVLRGPQGTLYGKNAIGGAIKLVGIEPSAEASAKVRLSLGNYGQEDARLTLNGALDQDEHWLGRLILDHHLREGWQNNVVDHGDKQMGERKESLRAKLAYRSAEDWRIRWSFDASRDDLNSTGRIPVAGRVPLLLNTDDINIDGISGKKSGPAAVPTQIFADLGGNYRNATNDLRGYTDRIIWGGAQKIDWQLQRAGFNAELSSITAIRHSQFDWLEDSSGLPASSTLETVDLNVSESYREYSQEFRLNWSVNDRIQLIAGAYFLRELTRRKEVFFFTQANATSRQFNTTDSVAVFGELEMSLGERDHISLGGRYSYDKKSLQQTASNNGAPAIILEDFGVESNNSWRDFSPRLTWRHQLQAELMFYSSLAKGIKSGGFQGVPGTLADAQEVVDPESAWELEMGFKSQWADNLRLNIAGFVTDYRDLQVVQFRTIENFGVFETSNAASANLSGLELEFVYSPLAQLSFSGSYAYLKARYDQFDSANGEDFKGSHLRQAPEHSAHLAMDLQHSLGGGLLQWHLGVQYQDESFREPDNSTTILPAYTLVDSKLSFEPAHKQWQLSLWAKNLTDRAYITHLYVLGGNDYALYGTPRTFGLSVDYTI